MKTNFTLWIKAAAVRALKTLAQTAVATIGTTAVLSEVDWVLVASALGARGDPVHSHERGRFAGGEGGVRERMAAPRGKPMSVDEPGKAAPGNESLVRRGLQATLGQSGAPAPLFCCSGCNQIISWQL